MKEIKPLNIGSVLNELKEEAEKNENFVQETGLCFVCRKRKVEEGKLKCKTCNEETEQILSELRKEPGFTEIILQKGARL